ncbi:site-specific recombinase XerD [Curtobacterium sp. PhB42]|uniref:tyrosine-type recombinase/integrase n=1 Tax=unclassified Curtobacterium TaxID=257496 RepID=UPI0010DD83B8|nr:MULTISPECIES: site-specific integrase [unclassified Curtobacterium]TDW50983.1 site-specific recombinase XerD [Curtobacterium sp. PhB42]TDW56171.1 site-specific recombinase XerD [Curtobacterium sp. PhB190]
MSSGIEEPRQLPSGKWQARFTTDQGERRSLGTFRTKAEAYQAVIPVTADIGRGTWHDPKKGHVLFRDYAEEVHQQRKATLTPATWKNQSSLLRRHLLPAFGHRNLGDITRAQVRTWWAAKADMPVTRRNAFFLLRVILNTAMEDELILATPAVIKNAGADVAKRRPTFTVADFKAVLGHLPLDLGAACWTLFGAHLRLGELCGLHRGDYSPSAGTLLVERQIAAGDGKVRERKTKTGQVKTVALPTAAVAALEAYIGEHPARPGDPMFYGPRGRLTANWLRKAWEEARDAAGLPEFHLHDVRHVSLTTLAQKGATLKEIQRRGGHASVTAALRYQHATDERDRQNANALSEALG